MINLQVNIYKVLFIHSLINLIFILETSNGVESLHYHIYKSCGLIGRPKRFGILEGLRKLFLYCNDIERTYLLALGIL